MKRKSSFLLKVLTCYLFLLPFGCKQENEHPPLDTLKQKLLFPSVSFDAKLEQIKTEEQARGFEVTENKDIRTLNAKKEEWDFTYYFDEQSNYKVAISSLPISICNDNLHIEKIINTLALDGFLPDNSLSNNPNNRVFYNKEKKITISLSVKEENEKKIISFSFGKTDENPLSWSRVLPLKHKSGLWLPLIGKGAPKDLMYRFEGCMSHTLNADSKPEKGVYIFDTANQTFPKIKYWFDVTHKAFLEEVAIFIDPNARPTPKDVDEYLTGLGFIFTPLKDDTNPIYYNKEKKAIAIAELNKPTKPNAPFEPKIQFVYNNIDDKLPKETVDLPIPVLEFNTITMDQAVEEYKKLTYYKSHEINGDLGGFNIKTKSEDFPVIWISDDKGKYALAIALAKDSKVINSKDIVTKLNQAGFTEKGKVAVETYIDRNKNVMAQIDRTGAFGAECVAFSANEF